MGTRLGSVLGNTRYIVGSELALLRLLGIRRRHASLHMLRRRSGARDGQPQKTDSKGGVDRTAAGRR